MALLQCTAFLKLNYDKLRLVYICPVKESRGRRTRLKSRSCLMMT